MNPTTPGAAPQPAPVIYAYRLTGPVELTLYAPPIPAAIARELLTTPLLRRMSTVQADALAWGICWGGRTEYASGEWEISRGTG